MFGRLVARTRFVGSPKLKGLLIYSASILCSLQPRDIADAVPSFNSGYDRSCEGVENVTRKT